MSEIYDNGNINWEALKELTKQTQETKVNLKCKKCGEVFFCNNYSGKFPLCKKHRYSFKDLNNKC